MILRQFLLILFFSFSFNLLSQTQTDTLRLENIMAGNEFIGFQPSNLNWSADSKHIYFEWGKDENKESQWFDYNLESKQYKKLVDKEISNIPVRGLRSDISNNHYYFVNGKRIFRFKDGQITLVFSYYSNFSLDKVMQDGSLIITVANQIICFNPDQGSFLQVVKTAKNPREKESNFLIRQQEELLEVIEKEDNQDESEFLLPEIHLQNELNWHEINKEMSHLLYMESNYPKSKNTKYTSYITKDGFTTLKNARPKVGREDPTHKIHLINLQTNESTTIDISHLNGIEDTPDYFKYYPNSTKKEGIKNVVYHNHGCSPDGSLFLIEIKSYDNKDRWICSLDKKGELTELEHQRDTAWIGGPGISGWTSVSGNVGWIDAQTIYFQSEESGYSHLYTYSLDKKKKTQLTEGRYEIYNAQLSKDATRFFVTANHNHPGNREFYTLDIQSKRLTGVLTLAGNHDVEVSPDEAQLAVRYSYINKPWEAYIAPLEKNSKLEQITQSTSAEFEAYKWREPAVVNITASDGTLLHARLYFPKTGESNGAGIIFVHGAGYLQNAHNWWSGYYREYMFHNLLADKGYTVMDIDYRASQGYGRDFRTAIYRNMGGKDLSDQLDGREYLINTYNLDSNRIGIYGGSYGGFITLMALLKVPGKFKCGAALRSVTDWAHYNHPYTSNILNTPELDPEAYKRSSPIYFAEYLEDKLIMLHGMEDDNVQYQDVVRLSQRFIELGKKDWDLIGYPVEKHGFKETSSWLDEYRRILTLFDTELAEE